MKKVLALILCTLMIVTAALPVFAEGAEPETAGKLAITEVAPNPADYTVKEVVESEETDVTKEGGRFEYIEIMNTVENTTVNLKDYYFYRFTFSHSGTAAYSGLGQILGTGANMCYGTTRVDLTSYNKELAYNVPVLVWLKTDSSQVSDFVTYWNNHIDDEDDKINAADVVAVDVSAYDVTKKWPNNTPTHQQKGIGFLPDSNCGYVISLIKQSADTSAEFDAFNSASGMDESETAANTNIRQGKADATTLVFATGDRAGKVANRYGYFDRVAYNAAIQKAKSEEPSTATIPPQYLYDSWMMPRYTPEGEVDVTDYRNTTYRFNNAQDASTKAMMYFLHSAPSEDPTPAKLVAGQFDTEYKYTPATSTVKGLSITEICVATGEGTTRNNYEFIEITNTSNAPIQLSNYKIILLGGTNSGAYHATFVARTMSNNVTYGSDVAANQHSYASLGNATLAAGAVAVVAFNGDVAGFKTYWEGRGSDFTNATVVGATYSAGSSIAARGQGFLPDVSVGYSVSLVDSTKATEGSALETAFDQALDTTVAVTTANVPAIINAADSVALIMTKGGVEQNVSCNFFNYIDLDRYYYDAEEDAQYIRGMLNWASSTYRVSKYGDAAIFAPSANVVVPNGQPLKRYLNTGYWDQSTSAWKTAGFNSSYRYSIQGGDNQHCVFVEAPLDSVPTPGALLDGQFGYNADNALISVAGYQTAKTATNGATDVRIIGNINISQADLAQYSEIGLEVAAAREETTANTVYDETNWNAYADSVCTRQAVITTDKVYASITDEANNVYTNENGYMFVINLSEIPVSNCSLVVRCFVVKNGVKTYTGLYQITNTSI